MYDSINFENSNYNIVFKDIQYEISIIDPFIELKRYDLVQNIKKEIREIFQKHKLNIDINNILPRFIMVQYKNKSYYVDPIIPYNANDYRQLKKDLYYLSNKKLKNKEIEKLINELDLTNKFNNAVDKLRKYIIVYTNNVSKYKYNIKYNIENNCHNPNFYWSFSILSGKKSS